MSSTDDRRPSPSGPTAATPAPQPPAVPVPSRNRWGSFTVLAAVAVIAGSMTHLSTASPGRAAQESGQRDEESSSRTMIETVRGSDSGTLVGLDVDKPALRLEGRELPLRDVLRVELNRMISYRRELVVHLVDGGLLYGGLGSDSDDVSLAFNGRLFPDGIRIPLEWVRQVDYRREGAEFKLPANFQSITDEDAILTAEGAVLRGVLESVNDRRVVFEEQKLGKLTLPWDQVQSVRIAALDAPPKLAKKVPVLLEAIDGSVLYGEMSSLDPQQATLESSLIGKLMIDVERIAAIEFRLGRVAYLSDRTPIRVVERGCHNLGFHWPWQRDRNVHDKGPLRIGTRTFRRGLGVHSESHLTYKIEAEDRTFQAWVGIDATGHPEDGNPDVGSVIFRVLVDGNERYNSGDLNWQALARRVEVDVAGGKELELVVDTGKGLYILDRADWGDARILRQ